MKKEDVMLRFFATLLLTAIATSYSGVQTLTTNVRRAKCIIMSNSQGSIWEPSPPSNDYYILGQYFSVTDEPPKSSVELIVGRSMDGSLKPPKGFHGKWKVLGDLTIWTMRCPKGYVSLGAIAIQEDAKPDLTKYRCIDGKETEKAQMKDVIKSTSGYSLRSIYSPRGWKNIFFFIDYGNFTRIGLQTSVYTLKKKPITSETWSRHDEADQKPPPREEKSEVNEESAFESYITLVVSGCFVLFVVVLFATLFCVRSRKLKERSNSVSASTTNTYLDSAVPSSGRRSSSESNFNVAAVEFGKLPRSRLLASSVPPLPPSSSSSAHLQQPKSEEYLLKDNILYHRVSLNPRNVLTSESSAKESCGENEYEIIKDDRITCNSLSPGPSNA